MGDSVVVCCARSMWTNFCWIVFLLSSSVTFAESRHHHHQLASNFVSVNYLPDGRIETRVHYNGISAKETTIANRNNSGSIIRELTDGKRFIKLVYNNNGTLKNCNFGRRKERIRSLMQVFEDEEDQSHMRNSIIDDDKHVNRTAPTSSIVLQRLGDSKPLPMNVRKWFDYPKLRRMCRKKKKQRKQQKKKEEDKQNFKLNFDDFRACLKMVGTTDANIVGNIFFNFVQTKCFVIKRKRICAEWEGKKCVRKETVKRAVLRTNLSY